MSLVRVREGDVEFNIGRARAEARNLTILEDAPVRDSLGAILPKTRSGEPVRRKRATSVDEEAAKKSSGATKATGTKGAAATAPAASSTTDPS